MSLHDYIKNDEAREKENAQMERLITEASSANVTLRYILSILFYTAAILSFIFFSL